MSEFSELSLSTLSSTAGLSHESLDRYRSSYDFELSTVDKLSLQLVSEVRDCTKMVLPDARLPEATQWQATPVRLGKIIPKEYQPEKGENTLMVFAPGWRGRAAGILPIGAAITSAIQEDRRPNSTVGITLDSLVNDNPSVNALKTNFSEYVANQAAALLKQVEECKSKKIVYVIHSLAALESIETILILEELLKKRGHEDVKIEATIFAQIPGLYAQQVVPLIERTLEINTDSSESRYVFPSPVDIEETKGLIALAHEDGDMSSVHRLEKWLDIQEKRRARIGFPPVHENVSEGKNRYTREGKLLKYVHLVYPENPHDNLPFVSEKVWDDLVSIDEELERRVVSSQDRNRLLKQRAELLKPVIKQKEAGPEVEVKQQNKFDWIKNIVVSNLNTGLVLRRLLMGIPQDIRDQVQFPISVAFAKNDVYFPADEAWKKIEEGLHRTGKKLFPHASSVTFVNIDNWVHKGPPTNPIKFGEIVRDMLKRVTSTTVPQRTPMIYTG